MDRSRRTLGILIGLTAGIAAGWWGVRLVAPPPPGPARPDSEPGEPSPAVRGLEGIATPDDWPARLGSPPRFVEITRAAGVDFVHHNGMSGKFHYPEVMGAGVGLLDYDGDGLLDLYFVNGNHLLQPPDPKIVNRLYHNAGDGTFVDVTHQAGVGHPGFGQGCCVADYDADGDPDLYVSNYGPNVLYRNDGDGTFTDVTEQAGVGDPLWGQTCSFFDYDGDGWLDLYVQNYLTYSLDLEFEAFIYIGSRKVLDYPSPKAFQGAQDRLFRNLGGTRFEDVTERAGLIRTGGKGMGCAVFDYDDDGDVDLFVANDSIENFLFRNRGNGTFEEVGLTAGVAYDGSGIPEASMGVDVGDYDADGRIDMVVPCVWEQIFTLYRNLGEQFVDASWDAGLVQSTSEPTGFNPLFLDYDSDGDLDLFFTTGGVRLVKLRSPDAPYEERYGIEDVLLASDGQGKFVDVSALAGDHFRQRTIGRGAVAGDLDADGDLDLVVCTLDGPPAILRNDTDRAHWVIIRLVGAAPNRDAIGASVVLEAGGRPRRAVVHGGVTYLSQLDRRLHFGLGDSGTIERLTVRWPGGAKQILTDLPVDRILTIEQGRDDVR